MSPMAQEKLVRGSSSTHELTQPGISCELKLPSSSHAWFFTVCGLTSRPTYLPRYLMGVWYLLTSSPSSSSAFKTTSVDPIFSFSLISLIISVIVHELEATISGFCENQEPPNADGEHLKTTMPLPSFHPWDSGKDSPPALQPHITPGSISPFPHSPLASYPSASRYPVSPSIATEVRSIRDCHCPLILTPRLFSPSIRPFAAQAGSSFLA
ncbi:hypothetical protein EDB81DRAFT_788011 [Dactylonectria macrodidyma]|uniref:Uncharacterized protein n=1 Tax=Dactylonectria macrodidyma TaxID=307937 RepID=A0A9P9JE52_9HYPO|nr:hypothetical protein EDB81DRAFT_788011 [Dactylonectria macrodidyma]